MVKTNKQVPKASPVKYPPNIFQSSEGMKGAADIAKTLKARAPPIQAPAN